MGLRIVFANRYIIVDVDFNLLDKLDFKDDIISNVFFVTTGFTAFPFVIQILISAEIILEVTLGQYLITYEVIKGRKDITHTKDCTEQSNKFLLILLSGNTLIGQRISCGKILNHIHVAGMELATIVFVSVVVIFVCQQQTLRLFED